MKIIFSFSKAVSHSFLARRLIFGTRDPWPNTPRELFKFFWNFDFWPNYAIFRGGFFALKSLHFRPSLLVTVFGLGSWFFSWGTLGPIPHKDFHFFFGNFEFWPTYAKFSIFLLIFFYGLRQSVFGLGGWFFIWETLGQIPREGFLNFFKIMIFDLVMSFLSFFRL